MDLNSVLDCMCEIKTMDNEFLAIGRISAVMNDEKSIEIVSCDGGSLPSMRYETKVKISIVGSKSGFLGLEGYVYIAHSSFWRLYDVSSLGENERRGYFRIKNSSHAEVEEIAEQGQIKNDAKEAADSANVKYPCIVTSVSISGLLLAIDDESCDYRIGATLQVNSFTIGESSQEFTLRCVVKRIDHHERLGLLLGCEFTGLSDREIQSLCQAIFTQQRLEIHRKKGLH
ncbi:MAG: PilZ domain-containing protein [Oscillospiraceae bacterium]|nr:PilZ domain-containing protein [Oscillospiraceae bacterium]